MTTKIVKSLNQTKVIKKIDVVAKFCKKIVASEYYGHIGTEKRFGDKIGPGNTKRIRLLMKT